MVKQKQADVKILKWSTLITGITALIFLALVIMYTFFNNSCQGIQCQLIPLISFLLSLILGIIYLILKRTGKKELYKEINTKKDIKLFKIEKKK